MLEERQCVWAGVDFVKGGHDWARLMLSPPGTEEGRGFEEGHCFCFVCINLHTISNTPLLADM